MAGNANKIHFLRSASEVWHPFRSHTGAPMTRVVIDSRTAYNLLHDLSSIKIFSYPAEITQKMLEYIFEQSGTSQGTSQGQELIFDGKFRQH